MLWVLFLPTTKAGIKTWHLTHTIEMINFLDERIVGIYYMKIVTYKWLLLHKKMNEICYGKIVQNVYLVQTCIFWKNHVKAIHGAISTYILSINVRSCNCWRGGYSFSITYVILDVSYVEKSTWIRRILLQYVILCPQIWFGGNLC